MFRDSIDVVVSINRTNRLLVSDLKRREKSCSLISAALLIRNISRLLRLLGRVKQNAKRNKINQFKFEMPTRNGRIRTGHSFLTVRVFLLSWHINC